MLLLAKREREEDRKRERTKEKERGKENGGRNGACSRTVGRIGSYSHQKSVGYGLVERGGLQCGREERGGSKGKQRSARSGLLSKKQECWNSKIW